MIQESSYFQLNTYKIWCSLIYLKAVGMLPNPENSLYVSFFLMKNLRVTM